MPTRLNPSPDPCQLIELNHQSGRAEDAPPGGPVHHPPPPLRTVHAVLPHTAHRHRSPSGMRRSVAHRSAEAMDPEALVPGLVVVTGPVAPLESVLSAHEDGQAFVDVAVDGG